MNIHQKSNNKLSSKLKEILSLYFVIFVLWTGYRIYFQLPEWFDEFIAKPILWLSPLFMLRKNVGNHLYKSLQINISYNILFGLFMGVLYFCLFTLFLSFKTGLPQYNPSHLPFGVIIMEFFIALSTGLIEEIVFRRYLLEEVLLIYNDRIIANSFIAILFTLIHLPIIVFVYKYPPAETISYLSILTITGFIYGLVYLHKKSLLASAITHGVWNFLGMIIR